MELLREMLNTLSFALNVAGTIWPSHQQWQKEKKERERKQKETEIAKKRTLGIVVPFYRDYVRSRLKSKTTKGFFASL